MCVCVCVSETEREREREKGDNADIKKLYVLPGISRFVEDSLFDIGAGATFMTYKVPTRFETSIYYFRV